MIKIVPLHAENEKENIGDNIPPNKQPVDPQIWYEIQGRNVLETLITDFNSRGHSSLILHENGDICVVENADEIPKEHLSSFPEKSTGPAWSKFWKVTDWLPKLPHREFMFPGKQSHQTRRSENPK